MVLLPECFEEAGKVEGTAFTMRRDGWKTTPKSSALKKKRERSGREVGQQCNTEKSRRLHSSELELASADAFLTNIGSESS